MPGCKVDFTAALFLGWFFVVSILCALCWVPSVRSHLARARHPLTLAALAAVLVRLVPALLPLPHDALVRWDIESYQLVERAVREHRDVYDLTGRYPYFPLQMYILGAAGWLATHTPVAFLTWVKLPSLAADAALAAMVGVAVRRAGRLRDAPALAFAFALNPISLLVSGYHGQFDAAPAALLFGAWLCLDARAGRWRLPVAALLFGLAVADKTWPALLAPVLIWRMGGPRRVAIFGVLAAIAPLATLALYEARVPGGALHAVRVIISYQGYVGVWGIGEVMVRAAGNGDRAAVLAEATRIGPRVLLLVLLCVYGAAFRLRRDPDRLALVFGGMYAASTGWGVHWLAWLVPFSLAGARRWAAWYVAVAGAYVASTYLIFGGVLWGFTWFTSSLTPLEWGKDAGLALWGAITLGAGAAVLGVVTRDVAALTRLAWAHRPALPSPPPIAVLAGRALPRRRAAARAARGNAP